MNNWAYVRPMETTEDCTQPQVEIPKDSTAWGEVTGEDILREILRMRQQYLVDDALPANGWGKDGFS